MKSKVICIYKHESGVDYHRLVRPLVHLGEEDLIDVDFKTSIFDIKDEELNDTTHICFTRFIPIPNPHERIKEWQSKGIKVIVDNDDFWELPKHHKMRQQYDAFVKNAILACMHQADEVWTTQPFLAAKIKKINSNVHIMPNGILEADEQWSKPKKESEARRIGYVAANHHQHDLKTIKIDLGDYESYTVDGGNYFGLLNTRYKWSTVDPHHYGAMYRDIDVAVIPLVQSKFNQHKSNLKMLEAAFTKTAIIVSNVHPYKSLIDSDNCWSVNPGKDWKETIDEVMNCSQDELESRIFAMYSDVQDYRLEVVNEKRLERLCATS
jgi:glycosyltransferase involved in cell wall biosynthesis